jgi:hypothetical protein
MVLSMATLSSTVTCEESAGTCIRNWSFRFPRSSRDIPVEVTIATKNLTEVWHRRFGESAFTSTLTIDTHTKHWRFAARDEPTTGARSQYGFAGRAGADACA